MSYRLIFLVLLVLCGWLESVEPKVKVGIEALWQDQYISLLKDKRIGILTNQTGVDHRLRSTIQILKEHAPLFNYSIVALFAPEHGLNGTRHNSEEFSDSIDPDGIPIYSLYGKTKRPTESMLKNIDVVIYDIQDIGSRSYTFLTALLYMIEEAAKQKIMVIVLDRPNPINGMIVDGPMLEDTWRSIVGYINVPYCHGMTAGELARFFNAEYEIGCQLKVISMEGWRRRMTFQDTGLPWIPTSPQIPEASTAFYYPSTGLIGELQLVSIGVGYTLPFKLIGAPWIQGTQLAKQLNALKLPGVVFKPFYYQPFFGKYAHENCEGVLIFISDPLVYKPVTTQYMIMWVLKNLYPQRIREAIKTLEKRMEMFNKVNGTDKIYQWLTGNLTGTWPIKELHKTEKERFLSVRKKYLLYDE